MIGVITGNTITGWLLTVWEPAKKTEERIRPFHFKMRWKVQEISEAIAIVRWLEHQNKQEIKLSKPEEELAA